MGKAEPLQTETGTQRQRDGRGETERGSESDRRQRHRLRGAGSARQKGGTEEGAWGARVQPWGRGPASGKWDQ